MKRSNNSVWMFYQAGNGRQDLSLGDRIRLVYPCGKVEWSTLDVGFKIHSIFDDYAFKNIPCWYDDYIKCPKDRKEALKRINLFDKENNWKKQVFIGEIK